MIACEPVIAMAATPGDGRSVLVELTTQKGVHGFEFGGSDASALAHVMRTLCPYKDGDHSDIERFRAARDAMVQAVAILEDDDNEEGTDGCSGSTSVAIRRA